MTLTQSTFRGITLVHWPHSSSTWVLQLPQPQLHAAKFHPQSIINVGTQSTNRAQLSFASSQFQGMIVTGSLPLNIFPSSYSSMWKHGLGRLQGIIIMFMGLRSSKVMTQCHALMKITCIPGLLPSTPPPSKTCLMFLLDYFMLDFQQIKHSNVNTQTVNHVLWHVISDLPPTLLPDNYHLAIISYATGLCTLEIHFPGRTYFQLHLKMH